jgi:type IV pilus assembly protein PilA
MNDKYGAVSTMPVVDQIKYVINQRKQSAQGGFTLIELMVVVAIIGILASIGIPVFMNFVKQAQTSDPIQNAASLASSVSGLLGVGMSVANVVSAVDGKVEDPTEATGGTHNISSALAAMAWTPSSGTTWEYTVSVKASTSTTPPVYVCVTAQAGSVTGTTWTATNASSGYIYYSSVPSTQPGWTGNTFTGTYLSSTTALTAGGGCSAAGKAVAVSGG